MYTSQLSYLSPKLEGREHPAKGGLGLFAREAVKAGDLLSVWSGVIIEAAQLDDLPDWQKKRSVQVEEGLYLVTTRPDEPADFVNHCCDPNAALDGQIALRALRDIGPGEEVCFDYATSDGSPYDEFECACGAPNCRGRITGNDWQRPDLQAKYAGKFSPYLQRRITALKRERARELRRVKVKANGNVVRV
jgi:hypothetical protein